MTALLSLIGGKATLIGGGIVAILVYFATLFKVGFNAGRNSQLAKEGKANAKTLDDLARANAARGSANVDRVSDDGFRRD